MKRGSYRSHPIRLTTCNSGAEAEHVSAPLLFVTMLGNPDERTARLVIIRHAKKRQLVINCNRTTCEVSNDAAFCLLNAK